MKGKLLMLLLIVVFALFLAACTQDPPAESGEAEVNQEVEQDENTVMNDFRDLTDANNPLEIKEFIDENIENVSQEEAGEMVSALERSLINNLAAQADRIFTLDEENELMEIGSVDFFFDEEKIDEIENDELREEVELTFDSGYKLINVEGNYNPIVDYAKLQKYNDYVSQEWIDYLEVRAMDSEAPPFVDAALMLDYDELAERVLKTEEYLVNYTNGSRYDEMLDIYDNKLTIYLTGIPNTQIYDYDTNEIYNSAYNSFVKTSEIEGSTTADITSRYIEAIDENNRIIDSDILSKGEELAQEAVDTFK